MKPSNYFHSSTGRGSKAPGPIHVVCGWIGNTERIARRHYLQTTEADFEKAVGVQQFLPTSTRSWRRMKQKNRVFIVKTRLVRWNRSLHLPRTEIELSTNFQWNQAILWKAPQKALHSTRC